ncbi:hypothetical protein L1987_71471 [Smallanthus sonchifolius]|uniref:Uncharacterized protein n=1 Tax=Smallanthus sonchifolius TaxID=185202 RepID=A0ACB9AST9_9ASTR|nr:hypothetical protein L1987_71471 [Smallanthus sonchifolius]
MSSSSSEPSEYLSPGGYAPDSEGDESACGNGYTRLRCYDQDTDAVDRQSDWGLYVCVVGCVRNVLRAWTLSR